MKLVAIEDDDNVLDSGLVSSISVLVIASVVVNGSIKGVSKSEDIDENEDRVVELGRLSSSSMLVVASGVNEETSSGVSVEDVGVGIEVEAGLGRNLDLKGKTNLDFEETDDEEEEAVVGDKVSGNDDGDSVDEHFRINEISKFIEIVHEVDVVTVTVCLWISADCLWLCCSIASFPIKK